MTHDNSSHSTRALLSESFGTALYNVWRLRTDNWNRLRDAARRLRRLAIEGGTPPDDLIAGLEHAFEVLEPFEGCFAFPGAASFNQIRTLFEAGDYELFAEQTVRLVRLLTSNRYRRLDLLRLKLHSYSDLLSLAAFTDNVYAKIQQETRPYFEVLVVDDLGPGQIADLQLQMREHRRPEDDFIYEVVGVGSWEEALLASLVNPNLQSVVIRYTFPFRADPHAALLAPLFPLLGMDPDEVAARMPSERSLALGRALKALRPELDIHLVTDAPVERVAGGDTTDFRRVFYHEENYHDLHLTLLKGVFARYETPFFSALRRYSQKPTGVFHALPISRGSSIARSHWIQDMATFYGPKIFQAETSATTGGLDSLLQPVGSIKRAQELAARAFGARQTFFVTNGTSTANKIVMQALMRPGDIILLSHDCHKSHPYAVILAGALPVYLDAYPLSAYSMYGAVPLRKIKQALLDLKRAGKLDRVKLLLLTNITFDGVTYDPMRVMEEVLAIKPDMVFLWDEAWFAFGRFSPTLRRRTAMDAARRLTERFASASYREEYEAWRRAFEALDPDDDATWLERRLLPDPRRARVRVYATHSTHKTLTSLRQGSMIHVRDQDFEHGVRNVFNEAYMTHTSTSPNYQIVASLDVGRRQVELEGYDLVQRMIQLAMTLRERIHADPLLQKYFRVLTPRDMVPEEHRPSRLEAYYDPDRGWSAMEGAWLQDEFVLDPSRITMHVGRTGMDGDTFKKLLMDRHDIQVNKTSRNTVLFMLHIGMTRGMVAHLIKVLTAIARELEDRRAYESDIEAELFERRVHELTEELPPLPYFSRFHRAFLPTPDSTTPEGDMREAFFLSYDDGACDYVKLDGSLKTAVEAGREVVSASFVTPYPPGFPVLVPGQVITPDIVEYLRALDVKEIHGYEPAYGLRIFREEALAARVDPSAAARRPERADTRAARARIREAAQEGVEI